MKKIVKVPWRKIWLVMPFLIAGVMVLVVIYFAFKSKPVFVNYNNLVSGDLSEAQKQTITLSTELNKFLVSLSTLMFGVLGFYLAHYRKEIQVRWVATAYFLTLILLGLTYYFTFRVYSQLTSDLAQNAFAMIPENSRVLYYLEMSFWTSAGSSLILLLIFLFVFIEGNRANPS